MTAIAVVRGEGGIAFATDGIVLDASNRVVAHACKMALFPEWSCILANRGTPLATARMQLGLQRIAYSGLMPLLTFDDVLGVLPDVSAALHAEILKEQAYPHFSFMIAGYSLERDRFESYSLRSREFAYSMGGEDLVQASYTLAELPALHFAPTPARESAVLAGMAGPDEPAQDAQSIAVRAICAARLERGAAFDEPDTEAYGVGGFVQAAVLTRSGLSSQIVHRWPDRIGELVDPAAGELLPPELR